MPRSMRISLTTVAALAVSPCQEARRQRRKRPQWLTSQRHGQQAERSGTCAPAPSNYQGLGVACGIKKPPHTHVLSTQPSDDSCCSRRRSQPSARQQRGSTSQWLTRQSHGQQAECSGTCAPAPSNHPGLSAACGACAGSSPGPMKPSTKIMHVCMHACMK
jgi:hypothetical protein